MSQTLFYEPKKQYLRVDALTFTYYKEQGGTLEWVNDYPALIEQIGALEA